MGPHTSEAQYVTILSPPQGKSFFFLVYTNIYLPIDRACATTVVPNRRNDIKGWHRRLKKTAGEVEKTGEKAGRHEMGGSSAQDASNLRLEIFSFSYICTNRDVFANEKISIDY